MFDIVPVQKAPGVIVVNNFFTDEELSSIWAEINYLKDKLKGPEFTSSAFDVTAGSVKYKKENKGIFINNIYNSGKLLEYSNIIKAFERVYSKELVTKLININLMYRTLANPHKLDTLLTRYGVGDYYKPHTDVFVITILGYFMKEPKDFEGGDLILNDFNVRLKVSNNTLVFLPSYYNHEVTKLVSENPNAERFSVAQFIYF